MRTLFDYQAFDLQTHGGVSRCMIELCNHMPLYVQPFLGVFESNNVYLQEKGYKAMESTFHNFLGIEKFKGKRRIFTPYFNITHNFNYWGNRNQNYSIKLLKEGHFDIFHPTFFDDYFLKYLHGKPFVLTIHDMIPEIYPQYFGKDDFQVLKKKILAPLAAHIVVPSRHTKSDVTRILGIPDNKISVIYHGSDECPKIDWESIPRIINASYILYVGSRDKYKNFEYFVKSCTSILKTYKDLKVICTGNLFDKTEIRLLEEQGVRHQFEVKFTRSEEEIANLYHFALAFVFPYEYEGFGLPILECYKADGLLVLNEASCFPEIAGEAAIYFSQDKKKRNLTETLEYVIQMSNEERNKQLAKQQERLKLYSWKKSSAQLAEVYRTVAGK